jgi:hypothetical protein
MINFKLVALIVLIILSVFLFLFISYAELKDGMNSLTSGIPTASLEATHSVKSILSEGILKTMNTIDNIV